MSFRLRRLSKPTLFAISMVAAAFVALLPSRWTGCVNGVFQPASPFSWALTEGTRTAERVASEVGGACPTAEEFAQLQLRNEQLERQIGHQAVLIAELETLLGTVSGIHDQLDDRRVKLILAAVIGGDASPRREVLRISKGAREGVQVGDWVAAGFRRDSDPSATHQDLVLRQWLIGRISEVLPHVSTVQLTTDPQFGTERGFVAKPLPDGSWATAEQECGLVGAGGGMMRIEQAPADFHESGYTLVLIPLRYPRPLSLVAGRITAGRTLKTGLHYDLDVAPWADARALSRVCVISLPE